MLVHPQLANLRQAIASTEADDWAVGTEAVNERPMPKISEHLVMVENSNRDVVSVIIFLLLVVDLVAPLLAHDFEDENVMEAREDVEDEEQDVQSQVYASNFLDLSAFLAGSAVTRANSNEARNESEYDVDRRGVVQADQVHLNKRSEENKSGAVPLDHMPDGRTGNGRLEDSCGLLWRLAILAGTVLPDVSVHIDRKNRHDQVEYVDQERQEGHRDPALTQDHKRVFGLKVDL